MNTTTYRRDAAKQGPGTTPAAKQGVDPGTVVGIVIGLLFLAGIAAFFIRRRYIKKRQRNATSGISHPGSQQWLASEWKMDV